MNYNNNTSTYLEFAAKFSFALYLFFTIYGTSLPFQPRALSVEEIASSNILNQIIFSSLFLISLFCISFKFSDLFSLIRREKFFSIFLVWCLATILWSNFPFISFKRYFQYFTAFLICTTALLYSKDVDENLNYFTYILAFFVMVSIVSVFTIPGALDEYGIWKGLASGKNELGQIALLSIIFWSISYRKTATITKKLFALFTISISLILLVGSRSGTSMISFGIVIMMLGLFQIDKIFRPIGTKNLFSTIGIRHF